MPTSTLGSWATTPEWHSLHLDQSTWHRQMLSNLAHLSTFRATPKPRPRRLSLPLRPQLVSPWLTPTQATQAAGTSSSGENSQPLLCMHLATSIVPPPPLITMACSFRQQVLMGTRKVGPIHFSLDFTTRRPQARTTTTTMPSTGRCAWVCRGTSTAGRSTSGTGRSTTTERPLCTATTP